MATTFLRLLALFTVVDNCLSQWSMDGKEQTFTFVTNKVVNNPQINWQIENLFKNDTLFQCSTYFMQCDPYYDAYLKLYSATIASNSLSYISVLTIKNVSLSLHTNRWFCTADNGGIGDIVISTFALQVFAAAESPTCDIVALLNRINVQITCGTKKVFPENKCVFFVTTNISAEYELKQGYISYTREQNLTTLYYKTTCTLVVSAAILGPGTHKFRVVMYPNIISNITEEMKRTSGQTSSIYLGYPEAFLGPDCKEQGYIKENINRSCTCYDNSTSILPTNINWLKNQSIFHGNGTLKFTTKRKESFQCKISNDLNWTDEIDFQPKISYPPDNLSVNIAKQVFDLCNDTNIFFSGTCFVSESNPEPLITVNINNSVIDITPSKLGVGYTFNKTMTSPGIYYISCHANGIEYSKNVSSATTTATIKGPPGIPEIFKNENEEKKSQRKSLLEVTKVDTITCQSKGGYPILRNISLKCGQEETHATNQDEVSITLNISNVSNGKCECFIRHESICLLNTSNTVQFKFVDSENSPVKEQDFEKIYLGVGVAAGCVVVIIALIFIVNNLHQGLIKKSSRGTADKLVNNEDIYFIKQEKFDIDMNIYPEYTNVVTTMSSAMEAPKNLKK